MKELEKAGFSYGAYDKGDMFIPTGVASLDLALGTGGLPVGYLTSIFGASGVTKSTLLYYVLENARKLGGLPVLFDQEFNFDRKRHEKYQLDPSFVLVKEDVSLELLSDNFSLVLDVLRKATKSNGFGVIAIDSFSATLSDSELKSGGPAVGLHSRVARFLCRSYLGEMKRLNIGLIVISQETSKIGVTFGATYDYLARGALESNSFLNIRLQRRAYLTDKSDERVGMRIKATVLKNKFAKPMRVCEYDFFYDTGIDRLGSIFEVLYDAGFLKKSGAWYSCKGLDAKFQGKNNFYKMFDLSEFRSWVYEIMNEIYSSTIGVEFIPHLYGFEIGEKDE